MDPINEKCSWKALLAEMTRDMNVLQITQINYSFLMKEGDTVEILVDPDNPKSFLDTSNSSIGLMYLMMFIGAAMPTSIFIPSIARKFKG